MIGSVPSPGGCGSKRPTWCHGGWPGSVTLASGGYLLLTHREGDSLVDKLGLMSRGVSWGVDLLWFLPDSGEPRNAGFVAWLSCFPRPQGLSGYLYLSSIKKMHAEFSHCCSFWGEPPLVSPFTTNCWECKVGFTFGSLKQSCHISQTDLELTM